MRDVADAVTKCALASGEQGSSPSVEGAPAIAASMPPPLPAVAEPCLLHADQHSDRARRRERELPCHTVRSSSPHSRQCPSSFGLAACATPASGDGGDGANEVVKIGVVGKGDPQWAAFEAAAADEGITIEIVDFADYAQPNPATTEGELDLNQFQHIVYLADYNVSAGEDLTPIGSTAIYPLGLYSTKYDSVKDIPEGETVAVPNDASNQARALLVLQSAGLIELKSGGTIFSDLADIDESKSKVKVTALEASLTPTSLPDLAAAVINNDFVEDAGLDLRRRDRQGRPERPERAAVRQHLRDARRRPGQRDLREARRDLPDRPRGAGRTPRVVGRHRRAPCRRRSPISRRRSPRSSPTPKAAKG